MGSDRPWKDRNGVCRPTALRPRNGSRHLPLAWESTANTIEDVLSAGKYVLVVVDEYVPGESFGDRAKLQAKAERVIRDVHFTSRNRRLKNASAAAMGFG